MANLATKYSWELTEDRRLLASLSFLYQGNWKKGRQLKANAILVWNVIRLHPLTHEGYGVETYGISD